MKAKPLLTLAAILSVATASVGVSTPASAQAEGGISSLLLVAGAAAVVIGGIVIASDSDEDDDDALTVG